MFPYAEYELGICRREQLTGTARGCHHSKASEATAAVTGMHAQYSDAIRKAR